MTYSSPAQISFPLGIPHVTITRTKQTRKGEFVITVESQKETTPCGICKERVAGHYGDGQAIRLRHLPILGHETTIVIRPRRGQCPNCLHNPTTTQVLDWYEQRSPHTKAYDRSLMKQLIGRTVSDVSLKEKVGYDAVDAQAGSR